MESVAYSLIVHGKVQGVFYRKSTAEKAVSLELKGWVKNNKDGTVELVAQGIKQQVLSLVEWCHKGPKNAVVTKVEMKEVPLGDYSDFSIIR